MLSNSCLKFDAFRLLSLSVYLSRDDDDEDDDDDNACIALAICIYVT